MDSASKITITHLTIRLLTVFAYFLPFTFFFTTCTGPLSSEDSFNVNQAIRNEAKIDSVKKEQLSTFIDSLNNVNVDYVKSRLNEFIRMSYTSQKKEFINQDISIKIISPNNNSLSGIGIIYYFKNLLGQILIGISLFLSVTVLFIWNFLAEKNIIKYILWINIVTVICFVIDCIFNNVDILFGTWILLLLLVSQLLHEVQQPNYKSNNNSV